MAHGVSAEVFQAAVRVAENTPDFSMERVANGVARLDVGEPDAHDVAQAMIACLIGDSGY